uniref:Solute carrier family 9 member C2 (putative) n=1 Tax=Loxodonta africana TaxID=9785 RepID=G3U2W0_LOXAF
EVFGMSGIVAVVTIGLNLDSISFKPRNELIITKFLIMFSFVYQQLIYTFFGIFLIWAVTYMTCSISSALVSLSAYRLLFVLGLLTIALVSPVFMHSSYEYDWSWGAVITWSGIKGVFSLLLAPEDHGDISYGAQGIRSEIIHCLSLIIDRCCISLVQPAFLFPKMVLFFVTGLCSISLPRQMAMQNAIQHIQEIIQNTINLFKTEKILTNVNWTLVEVICNAFNPYMLFSKETREHIYSFKTPDATLQSTQNSPLLTLALFCRVTIIPKISSFEKQCNDGILSVSAARILIGATKSYCPIQGKFMSIYDVSTYVKARSWLMKFKSILTFLEYHKEKPRFIASGNNKFLFTVYQIVFSEEFEYAEHIITLMYIYPMIVHLWPMVRELNVLGLLSINYYFMLLYVLQAALKIIILKRKYFQQCWNTLEFFIVVIGLVDVFCVYSVKLRPENVTLIQVTVIMGYFRMIRFLPITKVIIPILINIVDVLIKKRLSLMYSITKGYVKSQEDTKLLIKQISSRESIYQKLYDILETNRRDAVKELGLIEHEGRDVVIALKSKQAIQNVIHKAQKNLTFLWSRGIIGNHEGIEMKKVLLTKIKALNNIPMTIPPPTPDKYLHNIIWLENKEVLIEFFKHLRPQKPHFKVESILSNTHIKKKKKHRLPSIEFCTSGDIIGELNCLLKREIEYTAICETILQACFISLEDLYEGFDVFWPSLEYKIWLKLALRIASQYFESSLVGEDLTFQRCVDHNHAYVETLSSYNEMIIDNTTMKFVIIVYGSVIDMKTEEPFFAPSIIPKTCEQLQGTSDLSKLLVI